MWIAAILAILAVWYFTNQGSSDMTTDTDPISLWAQAIKEHEGWYPGSVSYRNNNPGNLKFSNQAGAVGSDPRGFAVFSSVQTGWDALISDLKAKVRLYPDFSILQIMTRYLGGDPTNPQVTNQGDPFTYAAAIASKLGVSVRDTLSNVFGGNNTNATNG